MRYQYLNPVRRYLRVLLLLGLLVVGSSIAACSGAVDSQDTQSVATDEVLVIAAPYQPNVAVPPQITDPEGRILLSPLLGEPLTSDGEISTADLEEIQLLVTVPPLPFDIQNFTETQVLTETYVNQMSFVLTGPASSTEINLEFPKVLSVDEFNSETVIHGGLDGTITYEDSPTANVLVTLAIIPERQSGRFNLTITPSDNTPQIALPFGELEFTPELTELVR